MYVSHTVKRAGVKSVTRLPRLPEYSVWWDRLCNSSSIRRGGGGGEAKVLVVLVVITTSPSSLDPREGVRIDYS